MADILEPPPRLSGEPSTDVAAFAQWLTALYKNFILERGVVVARDQPAGSFNPATGALEAFPVGSIFMATVDTDPATLLGYGTWARYGQGKVIVGVDESDPDFETADKTGGAKEVTLTAAEMPSHTHIQDSHNHIQDAHAHVQQVVNDGTDGVAGSRGASVANDTSVGTTDSSTATNQAETATNQSTGGDGAHENMPPFLTAFMWTRTA